MYVEIELIAICIVILQLGTFTHFTWWAITSLAISDFVYIVSTKSYLHIEKAAASIAFIVSCTVLILSLSKCTLFSDALDEHGTFVYVVGNFALHYFPSLRLLYRLWTLHANSQTIALESPFFFSGLKQIVYALSFIPVHLLLLYCMLNDPSVQYQCPPPLNRALFVGLTVLAAFLVELSFEFYFPSQVF